MKASSTIFGVSLLGSAAAFAIASSGVIQQEIEGVPLPTPPPLESFVHLDDAVDLFHTTSRGDGEVVVELRYDTLAKQVTLDWSWGSSGGEFDEPLARHTSTTTLSYWPTSARYIGNRKIVVAGKSSVDGSSIVEVWTFIEPAVSAVGTPTEYFLRAGALADRRLAFVAPQESGIGVIRALWRNRSLGGENVLALSFEGRDVYAINLATGLASRQMSWDQPVGAAPAEPLLRRFWPAYSGPYRHVTHGDLYSLTLEADVVSTGTDVHTLFLVDADKDGALDGSLTVTAENEVSLGLRDASLWQ